MSTFVNYLVNSIEDQWKEVDVLIERSAEERDTNPTLYSALCRASIVLMVAHLEGFTKEVARAILDDANQFSSFRKAPYPIQATFCKTFTGANKEDSRRTKELIDLLCGLETKLSLEPFLIERARGNSKNPSPRVIDKICANFGVSYFFSRIENSQLDIIFSGVRSDTEALLEKLTNHTSVGTEVYPYSMNVSEFGIDASDHGGGRRTNTFWMTFLDQLLESRNGIAHGSSTTNSLSVGELIEFRNKVAVLQHALVLVLCHEALPKEARAC
ncbi:MAG: hypothetical protein DCF15_04495 [Phormidesmis priestleyi]|uniref:RiboL-PSP-HEPN domain-containing protein n=1 Tax=Phormidesmis priestleyi TaxID=268141 RepID=A0A2W4ZUW8_9CYAN|nr:MAG: hypothetical protein DCF15_04495 [Phormidesmis priestleyi]